MSFSRACGKRSIVDSVQNDSMSETTALPDLRSKWRIMAVLCLAELFVMSVWFSATAVVPALIANWKLTGSDVAWLTMSVQIGFVIGTFGSSLLNLADLFSGQRLFAISSFLASLATAFLALFADNLTSALLFRFFTGIFLAGVYPVGMKIMATWTRQDRGLGIGLLVGALTIGSATPHLLNSFGSIDDWKSVLYLSAGFGAFGGVMTFVFVKEGPYRTALPRVNWRYAQQVFRQRELVLANLGYLGHMWELYAMWSWLAVFLLSSFRLASVGSTWAGIVSFMAIAAGGLGSVMAGFLADRYGRTTITIVSMILSGSCALLVGMFYGGNPAVLACICLIWGFAIVADSAQFSACVSELCQPEYVGTALTLQTCLGFLLTMITIRIIPTIVDSVGWNWAFAFLSIGPFAGVWAMYALRQLPAANRLAGGRR
jgi:MFS family permease